MGHNAETRRPPAQSNLLINEEPLQVLPTLAVLLGLNQALVIQQVHYWSKRSQNVRDGHAWVWNTYADWQRQFPFWSEPTIRRIFLELERPFEPKDGDDRPARGPLLISSGAHNSLKFDRTKWYRVNYVELERLSALTCPSYQSEPTTVSKRSEERINLSRSERINLSRPIPESPENTCREDACDSVEGTRRNSTPDREPPADTLETQALRLFHELLPAFNDYYRTPPTGILKNEIQAALEHHLSLGRTLTLELAQEAVRRQQEADRQAKDRRPRRFASQLMPTLAAVLDEQENPPEPVTLDALVAAVCSWDVDYFRSLPDHLRIPLINRELIAHPEWRQYMPADYPRAAPC